MPDLETFSLSRICGTFDEAMRTIPGYDKYDPTVEPKALIDYNKTKDNFALYINDCMRHKKGEKDKSKKIRKLIEEKTGKTPRKDAVACSIILTLPEGYKGDPHIFFVAAHKALMIAAGIKESDVLYSVVHVDESQPHLHFAFLPTSYVRDYDKKKEDYDKVRAEAKMSGKKEPSRPASLKGDVNRKIEEDEIATGYNCGRFDKMFLHKLNETLEQCMAEQGVECKIGNGKGSQFKVEQMLKKQREESVALAKKAETEKSRADKLTIEIEKKHQRLTDIKNLPRGKAIVNKGRLEELEEIEKKYKIDFPKIERAERDLKVAAETMEAYCKAYEKYQKEKQDFDSAVNEAANKKVSVLKDKAMEFIKKLGLWEKFEVYRDNPIEAKGIKW